MLKGAAIIATTLWLVTLTPAQPSANHTQPIAVDPEPLIQRLDNGLSVVIEQKTGWDDVCIQLWFKGGSRLDAPELAGRSRRALQTWLRAQRLREQVAALGGSVRLAAHRDSYGILIRVAPQQLGKMIALLPRLYRNPSGNIGEPLDVVVEEHPALPDVVWRAALTALLGGHPDAVEPSLLTEAATKIPPDELGTFAAKWFIPAQAVLAIGGDVQPIETFNLAKQAWSQIPWQAGQRLAAAPLPERVAIGDVEAAIPGVALAWSAPNLGAFENVYLDVLMAYLKLRLEKDKSGFALLWRHDVWNDGGVLVLYLQPQTPTDVAALRQAGEQIQTWIHDIAAHPPEPLVFLRAAGIARRHYLRKLDDLEAIIALESRAYLNDGDWELVERECERLADPHVEPLQIAAKRLEAARSVRLIGTQAFRPSTETPLAESPLIAEDEFRELEERSLAPRVSLRLRPLPGRELAEVITLVQVANHRSPTSEAMGHPFAGLPFAAELAEYLDLHAATLEPLTRENPPAIGWRATAPGDRADSLIEWTARILRTELGSELQADSPIELVVIGNIDPELVELAAREAWVDVAKGQSKPTTQQNSTTSESSPAPSPSKRDDGL